MLDPIEDAQIALESLTSTEARLAASAGLLFLAALMSFVVAPHAVRKGLALTRRAVRETPAEASIYALGGLFDVPFPVRAIVRSIQAVVLVATGLSLLVVWGRTALAFLVLTAVSTAFPYFVRVLLTVGLLVGAIAGTRYLERRLDEWLADANYVTAHQEGVVFRVLQLCIFLAAGLTALSLWEVNLGGLLVGAGFLGIVVGMAARQTLGSLIAGFVLMFSRPFEIGDWVAVDDHEGIVTDITIVNTRLRSFDGETVVLPNDNVSNSTVINRTNRKRLRIRVTVGIDYDADIDRAESVALEAIESVDDVAEAPKPDVLPMAFDDSAISLECRFWIQPPTARTKWYARAAVIRSIRSAFDRERIDIPFPQRTLGRRIGTDDRSSPPGSDDEFTYADEQ